MLPGQGNSTPRMHLDRPCRPPGRGRSFSSTQAQALKTGVRRQRDVPEGVGPLAQYPGQGLELVYRWQPVHQEVVGLLGRDLPGRPRIQGEVREVNHRFLRLSVIGAEVETLPLEASNEVAVDGARGDKLHCNRTRRSQKPPGPDQPGTTAPAQILTTGPRKKLDEDHQPVRHS
jgi:hypothetical protein